MVDITFPEGAENYYYVDKAKIFMESPLDSNNRRWRCCLCGFPQGDFPKEREDIGAYCCGGCGQSTVRPFNLEIGEYE